jgi:hypothetical protein
MNLSRYTVDVCFDGPLVVFRAKSKLSFTNLMNTLQVSKGEGKPFIMPDVMSRSGAFSVPSHLLYVVEQGDVIRLVGAIDDHFDSNHEFAVRSTAQAVLARAAQIARELHIVDAGNYERVIAVMA